MKKYVLIISGCFIVIIAAIIFCFWIFNPRVIFEKKFSFKLPSSAEIVNKSYSVYYDSLELKIRFNNDDYSKIVDGIENYAQENLNKMRIDNDEEMYSCRTFCKWWDEEKEEAILAYDAFKQGRWGAKTRTVAVLITKNNEGQYFLHIYY